MVDKVKHAFVFMVLFAIRYVADTL